MYLNSIILHNIRSHSHTEIEFQKGVSIFTGDIGSGKSTLLMGIEFALFGLGSVRSQQMLRKTKKTGYVMLDFTVNDIKYSIKRTLIADISRGTITTDNKNTWLKKDGVDILLSPSDMKQYVLKILNFKEQLSPTQESKIYRYAIFTPQSAMKDVLNDKKDRLDTIRKAFHIEEYSVAIANTKNLLGTIKKQMYTLQALSEELPLLEDVLKEMKTELDQAEKTITETNILLNENNAKTKTLNTNLTLLNNQQKIYLETQDKIKTIQDDIKNKEAEIIRLTGEKTNIETNIVEKTEELKKYNTDKPICNYDSIGDIQAEITKINQTRKLNEILVAEYNKLESVKPDITLEEARTNLDELLKKRDDIQKANRNVQDKIDILTTESIELETVTKLDSEVINKLNDSLTSSEEDANNTRKCTTCQQPLNTEHTKKIISEKEKNISDKKQRISEIQQSISKIKTEEIDDTNLDDEVQQARSMFTSVTTYNKNIPRIKELKDQIDTNTQSGGNDIEELLKIKDDLVKYDNDQRMYNSINEIITSETNRLNNININDVQSTLDIEREKLVKILDSNENGNDIIDKSVEISKLEDDIKSVTDTINALNITIATNTERQTMQKGNIKRISEKITKIHGYQNMYKQFEKTEEWLSKNYVNTILEIEKNIMLNIHAEFNTIYKKWIEYLIEDSTKESYINEAFVPILSQDGVENPVSYMSGGEQTSVALAYRLALNDLVRQNESIDSSLLILDEPTDGFSQQQLQKMSSILSNLKSDQIILVSHDRELESCADHKYNIIKNDGVTVIRQ